MPKWTYNLTLINNTDRDLKLVSSNQPWGKGSFPSTIKPGEQGELYVYAKAGTATGIECYFSMRDVVPKGESSYGTINFSLDMPYWKSKNSSSLECTGILKESGFQKISNGAHDFATTATISTSLRR